MVIINSCTFTGRLTRDPDIGNSGKTTFASFGLAVKRNYKNSDGGYDTDFFEFRAYGRTADFVEKYFKKGMKADIASVARQDHWTDKEGKKQNATVFVVNTMEFGESKSASGQNSRSSAPTADVNKGKDDDFMAIPDGIDEQLPFN